MTPTAHHPRETDWFLGAALGLLLLGVALGAVLRVGQLTELGVPVGQATHAHSHTLYWGWAGLGLFALFFERVGLRGRGPRLVLGALALQALATFFVFYRYGYGKPGVVLSAMTLFPFLAAVVLFLRAARGRKDGDVAFLRAATVYVVLAYVSALSRVVLKVRGIDDPFLASLAVHLFLGTFGAFFVLGLMGLTVRALGGAPGPGLAVALGLGAPLVAFPSVLTIPGVEGTALGSSAKLAAFVMLVPAALWTRWVFQNSRSLHQRGEARGEGLLWRTTALAWATSVLLFALASTGVLERWALSRHAAILVIHLQTLGVVTASLLLLIVRRLPRPSLTPLLVHQAMVAVMLAGLGLATIAPGKPGLVLAAVGGLGVVACHASIAWRFGKWLFRQQLPSPHPQPSPPPGRGSRGRSAYA